MSNPKNPQRNLAKLLARLETTGLKELTNEHRRLLASVFVHEFQKGAFQFTSTKVAEQRRQFAAHLRCEFVESVDAKVVIDYSKLLLSHARRYAREHDPIPSLIIYLTWVEHWLNGVLTVAVVRNGGTPEDAEGLVRNTEFKKKLGSVLAGQGLPALSEPHRTSIRELAELRNEFVHYKWVGLAPHALEQRRAALRKRIRSIEADIRYCFSYENQHVAGPALKHAFRLFRVRVPKVSRLRDA